MDAMGLSRFSMALQWERAAVSLAVFLDARSGQTTDLSKEYAVTDAALRTVEWRTFGPEKVFENPLRFQIRIDDFRYVLNVAIIGCLGSYFVFVISNNHIY